MEKDKISRPAHLRWVALSCLVAFGLIPLAIFYYRYEAQHIQDDKYEDISAIIKLKTDLLQDWRRQRLADVRRIPGPLVKEKMARLLQDPTNPSTRAALQVQLNINKKGTVYADALFLDTKGNILLSDNPDPTPVAQATIKAIEAALKDRIEVLSNLFRDSKGIIYIDAVAPIPDNSGQPIAIVVLRSKAADVLYPLIQTWPTSSKTSETLLVCRDGDFVLFLNELRHRSNTALTLRVPLTDTNVPGVQAILGNYGRFRGKDYRGVEVLAVLQPVPQSPWSIVGKVDAGEILTEVKYRAWVIAIIVIFLIGISAGLIRSFYRKRQEVEGKQAEESLRRVTDRLALAASAGGVGIWDYDVGNNRLVWDDQMFRLYGITQDQFSGAYEAWQAGVHPEDRQRGDDEIRLALQGEKEFDTEFRILLPDGTTRNIRALAIVHRDASGQPLRMIGTNWDISVQKRAEETIKVLLKEKELLLKEVHHRIKNNINTTMSLLQLHADTIKDQKAIVALMDAKSRLRCMSVLYDKLYRTENMREISTNVYLTALVDEIIVIFPNKALVKIEKRIDDFKLDAKVLSPLGIIINELLTNIMKYAFIGRDDGLIIISATIKENLVTIVIEDNGIGIPESIEFQTSGEFGLWLVGMLTEQLRGTIKIERGKGTRFILEFGVAN